MTEEEKKLQEKALLETITSKVKEEIKGFATEKQISDAVEAVKSDLLSKIGDVEAIKASVKEIEDAAIKQGEIISMLKGNSNDKSNTTVVDAIVNKFTELKINSFKDLKSIKDEVLEIKANITTSLYNGTASRTQEISPVRFIPTRPFAFIGQGISGGTIGNGKSILMWTPATYTSNAGYAGEGTNTVTENAAAATEKTRLMAKISAKQYITAETFEDLPQFAQRLQEQLSTNSMLFLDQEIWSGDGADGGALTQHVYGIKSQGCTAFDVSIVDKVEKANIGDLVDACSTQAKLSLHDVNTVWMNPKTVQKLRTTKDTDGQYIINRFTTGEMMLGGLRVIENTGIGANEMLVGNAAAIQLWIKRNLEMKLVQIGTDAEVDRYTAILFARAQCLVEDEDKKALIYVSDISASLLALTAGA